MKKILIGLSLGLTSMISQAAPTDCRQLVEDGEVDCIKATSWFGGGSGENLFPTFEAYVDYVNSKLSCDNPYKVCYIQYENNPPEPPEGREPSWMASQQNNGSFPYTQMYYNTSNPQAGSIVITSYYTDPNKGSIKTYSKHGNSAYHFRVCPENTIAVHLGPDTYLRYCKPNSVKRNNSPSCDTGCNASSGNVSIGN